MASLWTCCFPRSLKHSDMWALISKPAIAFMDLRKYVLKHPSNEWSWWYWELLCCGVVLLDLSCSLTAFCVCSALITGLDAELSYVRNDVVNHYALSFNLLIPSETNNLHFSWHAKSKVSRHNLCLSICGMIHLVNTCYYNWFFFFFLAKNSIW